MNSPSWNDAISSAELVGESKTTFWGLEYCFLKSHIRPNQ